MQAERGRAGSMRAEEDSVRLRDTRQPEFVGRESVLTAIAECLDTSPALVLIEGEAGIGKSRLVREVMAVQPDSTVLLAVCPLLEEPFPLGAVVDGLRRFDGVVRELELSPLTGALRPLFPEWSEWLPPALDPIDDPRETRHRIFRALRELVQRLGVQVLVVEDAHWADAATLEWLLSLAAAEPVHGDFLPSIVVTYRSNDVLDGSLLVRLTSRPTAAMERLRIELEPLDVDQSRRLVSSMLGAAEVSEQFASFLHQNTDGVPLALEETVRLMRDRHDIIHQSGTWTRRVLDELQVPPTVRDSVLERVDRLPPEARSVLRAAAILAEPADDALLAEVADLGEAEGRRGVAGVLTAGLMREGGAGQLAFRHVLDAMAVKESIPSSERRYLHSRAGSALEKVEPSSVARLARHCREAGDTDAWCKYGEQAADIAVESGHDRTAVVTLLDLLTKADHPTQRRARLVRKLAEAAYFGATAPGDLLETIAQTLRDVLSEETLPRVVRGELRLLLGRILWDCGEVRASFAEYESAVPDLDDRPDLAIRAMMNLAMPEASDWPGGRHLNWLHRATELRSRIDSSSFHVVNRPCILLLLGEDSGWDALAELTAQKSGIRERQRAALGLVNAAEVILLWGRYDEVRHLLEVATEHVRTTKFQRLISHAQLVQAFLDWHTGCWSGLRGVAAELAEAAETEPRLRQQVAQLVDLLDLVSSPTAAIKSRVRKAMDGQVRRGQAEPTAATAAAILGRTNLAEGAIDDALRMTTPTMEMIVRKGVWLWAAEIGPVHLSALVRARRVAEARALFDDYADAVDNRDAPAAAASVQLCRALLDEADGDLDSAAEEYGLAADAWAGLPRPYDELLARERQSRCRLASGDRDQSLLDLADAEKRLRDLGARWDADRIAHLLRQHGVEVARTWRRGRQGYGNELSPRELEVVELVARGMTNKQIADALFISPRTVSRHLSVSMRKLSVTSRTALAMAAAESGLLATESNR